MVNPQAQAAGRRIKRKLRCLRLLKTILDDIGFALLFLCPYLAIVGDRAAYRQRGYFAVGGEFALPLIVFLVIFVLWGVSAWIKRKYPIAALDLTSKERKAS